MREQAEFVENSAEARELRRYRWRLLAEVALLALFCLLLVFERIAYPVVLNAEKETLAAFQAETHLSMRSEGRTVPADILDGFYRVWGRLSDFSLQFLLVTHALVTMYVGTEWSVGAKVAVASLGTTLGVTLMQLLYAGARPFWTSRDILSAHCNSGFSHPDLGCALLIVVPGYAYYCWRRSHPGRCNAFGLTAAVAAVLLIEFLNYVVGDVFLVNIALSVLLGLAVLALLTLLDASLDRTLRALGRGQGQLKWVFGVLVTFLFLQVVYADSQAFPDVTWVTNYLSCARYTESPTPSAFDRTVGAWFTFGQSATCFALMGLVLAFSVCQKTMASRQWSSGTTGQRLANVAVCNLLLAPSWVFELLAREGNWVEQAGLNTLMVDSVHYFLLYFFLFGLIPPLLLARLGTVERLDYEDKLPSERTD